MRAGLAHAASAPVRSRRTRETLRRFLQAYWLRPENAFWMTLRSDALTLSPLEGPVVDVNCGDGVFTFLHAGGVFAPEFDVFGAVTDLGRIRDEHRDMFDCVDQNYRPPIVTSPGFACDAGTDAKPALLAKANRLNIYRRLIEHDSNSPFPLADDSFQTVYCNAAYWVKDIDTLLTEIARITRPGGRVILQVKLDSLADYTLEKHREKLGSRFLEIIGRGRLATWPSLADRSTWECRFAAAGLTIEDTAPFVTRSHAHIWDIGLRPIAPMLARMANALTPETRLAIKNDWVELFCELLEPICDPGFDLCEGDSEPAEVQYLLKPT